MNPLDEIAITGLAATAHHGVYEHERRDGQPFVIDVVLRLDLAAAAEHDDLSLTVDYGVLAQQIVQSVEREPVDLIETVAERIAALVLGHPPVQTVTVTVHKPKAPLGVAFDDVSVSITRARRSAAGPVGFGVAP